MSGHLVAWEETWCTPARPLLRLRPARAWPLHDIAGRTRQNLISAWHLAQATGLGACVGAVSGNMLFWLATGCLAGALFTAASRANQPPRPN